MIGGRANVAPHRVAVRASIVAKVGGEELLDGRANTVDDEWRLRDWISVGSSSASRVAVMAPHREWPRTTTSRVPPASAANSTLPTCDGETMLPGDANHEQVAQSLVEHDLGRHAGVRAAENDGERLLAGGHVGGAGLAGETICLLGVGDEPPISLPQPFERLLSRDHGGM